MWKRTPETTSETAQKKPRWIEKVKKTVKKFKDRIKSVLGRSAEEEKFHEEAWNKFPEETKKEMLESLAMRKKFKWRKKDIYALTERKWEFLNFKEWVVKEDKIWKYIEVNGMKCREWQPGISGFTYKEDREKWYEYRWLQVWFCNKWNFISRKWVNDPQAPRHPDYKYQDYHWYDTHPEQIIPGWKEYPDYATTSSIHEIRKKEWTWEWKAIQ